jgi:hypothetical protein
MWRFSTVYLAGITFLSVGCIVDAGPDDYDYSGGYHDPGPPTVVVHEPGLSVGWDLSYLDGTLTDCDEADTPTVRLRATPHGPGPAFTATFACAAGGGTTTGLTPGVYDIALDLRDPDGRIVSTVEHPAVEIFAGAVTQLDESAVIPVQVWDLVWRIGHRPGHELTCRDVGAVSVQFTAQRGGEEPAVYQFPCDDYGALTTAIPPGNYQVRMLLLDARNRPMGDTGPGEIDVRSDSQASLDADFDQ